MMVFDEFNHASIRERERERERERDSCLVFRGKKHCGIEQLAPDVDVSKI